MITDCHATDDGGAIASFAPLTLERVKKCGCKLSVYRRELSSRRARKVLSDAVRSTFLGQVVPLLADVKAFTRQVACPEGSASSMPAR